VISAIPPRFLRDEGPSGVAPPKNITNDEEDVTEEAEETTAQGEGETSESGDDDEAARPAKPTSTGKRPLGAKEVIPFQWKLVGESDGIVLTLFKSVERNDVESQYERVKREGYYKELRILDVNEKIKQPKPPPPAKTTRPSVKKVARAPKKAAGKAKRPKAKRVTAARAPAKKRPAKKTAKTTKKVKSAKKKAKTTKSTKTTKTSKTAKKRKTKTKKK
jgi:hypothetical protein